MTPDARQGTPRPFGLGRIALRQLRSRLTLAISAGLTLAAAATGTAVLMATHDCVAVEYADRVVTMEDGRLAAAI
jgi:ABC-type lipoprotein export system ATPase subunit